MHSTIPQSRQLHPVFAGKCPCTNIAESGRNPSPTRPRLTPLPPASARAATIIGMIRKTRLFTPGPTPCSPPPSSPWPPPISTTAPPSSARSTPASSSSSSSSSAPPPATSSSCRLRHRRHGSRRLQPHLARRPRPRPHRRQVRRALDRPRQSLRLRSRRRLRALRPHLLARRGQGRAQARNPLRLHAGH